MAKHGGIPWDCILGAELVRHYKPDPETYMSPVEFFDLTPPEVMMVAAHQGDLQVPKRLGLRTAYVAPPVRRWLGRDVANAGGGQLRHHREEHAGARDRARRVRWRLAAGAPLVAPAFEGLDGSSH